MTLTVAVALFLLVMWMLAIESHSRSANGMCEDHELTGVLAFSAAYASTEMVIPFLRRLSRQCVFSTRRALDESVSDKPSESPITLQPIYPDAIELVATETN